MSSRAANVFNAAVGPQALGQLVTVLASLGSTVVLAHSMPTGAYGAFLAAWSFMTLTAGFVRLGMKASLQREVPLLLARHQHEQAESLIASAWFLCAVSTVISGPIVAYAVSFIVPTYSLWSLDAWLIVVITGAEAARTVGETVLRSLGKPTASQLSGSPLRGALFLAVTLVPVVLSTRWQLSDALLGLFFANVVTVGVQFASSRLLRGVRSSGSRLLGEMKSLLLLGPKFILLDLSAIALSQGDILIAAHTLRAHDVAYYAVAVRLVTIMTMPAVVVGTALAPKLTYLSELAAHTELAALVQRTSLSTFAVTLAGTIVFALVGKTLLPIVYGHQFVASYPLTLILAVGVVINSLFQLSGWLLVSIGRENSVLLVMALTSLAEFAVGYWLANRYGSGALAGASSVATFVQSGLLTYLYARTSERSRRT